MRRFGLLAVPVVAAVGLLVAGCGNYTQTTVSPLPQTVQGSTTPATPTAAPAATTAAPAATTAAPAETTAAPAGTTAAPAATTATPAPAGGAGDPVAGKAVFASAGCAACHTLKDAGAAGQVGPNLDVAKPSAALVRERVTNGMGVMPSFSGSLSAKQIDDVVAYVSTVAGK